MVATENKMEFEQFIGRMKEAVAEQTGGKVIVQEVFKNNNTKLHGMTILQGGFNLSPTMYLEYFYKYYERFGFEEALEKVLETYEENKPTGNIDVSFFTEYEKVRPMFRLRLVNYNENKEMLESVPHYQYLDFAVLLTVILTERDGGSASILVHNHHLAYWNRPKEELFKAARENMEEDYSIITMESVLKDLISEKEVDFWLSDKGSNYSMMYVMTNRSRWYGASTILIPGVLKRFADDVGEKKIYIIPSSVHEVILLVCRGEIGDSVKIRELRSMVQEVNRTQLLKEEILSNKVYIYDYEQDILF